MGRLNNKTELYSRSLGGWCMRVLQIGWKPYLRLSWLWTILYKIVLVSYLLLLYIGIQSRCQWTCLMGSRVMDLGQSGICRVLNSFYIGSCCRHKMSKSDLPTSITGSCTMIWDKGCCLAQRIYGWSCLGSYRIALCENLLFLNV